jgi:hypothetical protein
MSKVKQHQSNKTEYHLRVDGEVIRQFSDILGEEVDEWARLCGENKDCYVDIVRVDTTIILSQFNYGVMDKHFKDKNAEANDPSRYEMLDNGRGWANTTNDASRFVNQWYRNRSNDIDHDKHISFDEDSVYDALSSDKGVAMAGDCFAGKSERLHDAAWEEYAITSKDWLYVGETDSGIKFTNHPPVEVWLKQQVSEAKQRLAERLDDSYNRCMRETHDFGGGWAIKTSRAIREATNQGPSWI